MRLSGTMSQQSAVGAGERLLEGVGRDLGFEPLEVSGNHLVTHLRYRVTP